MEVVSEMGRVGAGRVGGSCEVGKEHLRVILDGERSLPLSIRSFSIEREGRQMLREGRVRLGFFDFFMLAKIHSTIDSSDYGLANSRV